jgi:hypothetical protein
LSLSGVPMTVSVNGGSTARALSQILRFNV